METTEQEPSATVEPPIAKTEDQAAPPPPLKRPSRHDMEVVAKGADSLMPTFLRWLKSLGDKPSEEEMPLIRDRLAKAIRYHSDGFEIAQRIKDWIEPDAELVEVLDMASFHVNKAHEIACKEWVLQTGIQPPALGLLVQCPTHGENGEKGGVGRILENHPDGRSTVEFPKLGHGVKRPDGGMSIGTLLEWERLVPEPDQPPPVVPPPSNWFEPGDAWVVELNSNPQSWYDGDEGGDPGRTTVIGSAMVFERADAIRMRGILEEKYPARQFVAKKDPARRKIETLPKPSSILLATREELLAALRAIARATAPGRDGSRHHESAYALAVEAVVKGTGKPFQP
jgi:hypothetical protein